MHRSSISPIHLIIIVAVTCLWGFNFSVIKAGVDNLDPFILAGLRFTFAAFPAILFVRKPDVDWRYIALYGITFGVGVWGMMSMSIYMCGLSAGITSLTLEFSAFISVLMGFFFLKEHINMSLKIGLALSLLGLVFIANITDGSVTSIGLILALIGAFSFSSISLMVKKIDINDMFAFIAWSCLFAPLPLFAMAYVVNGVNLYSELTILNLTSFGSILFQAYPTTLLGYWIWNKMLTKYPLSMMSSFKLLVPIFALIGSVIFYDEQLGMNKIIAFSLIITGVVIPLVAPFIKSVWFKKLQP
ncbi:EamA family transporter [Moritella viscosa]|uniref:EamA family transporter n=1 Tax=Moritella viscosa TaxID=80854 RepID=UPI00406BFC94